MNKAISGNFRQLLKDTDFIIAGEEVKGALSYLPFGLDVRNRLYDLAITDLKRMGFQQVLLTDIVANHAINKMEKVSANAKNFFAVKNTDFSMAAGHEIPFYLFIRQLLKNGSKKITFPLQYFHFGPGYRFPKNGNFPFTMGERKSFLECYSVHTSSQNAEQALDAGIQWNRRLINDILKLPAIEVNRPIITNKKFSKLTICIDTLTPIGKTVITGMTYFHDDIFSRPLDVQYTNAAGEKSPVHVAHFGISENILFSFLLNAATPDRLRLLNVLAPVQVLVLNAVPENKAVEQLTTLLSNEHIRFSCRQVIPNSLEYEIRENEKRGIPLLISFSASQAEGIKVRYHFNGEQRKTNLPELVHLIPALLKQNDTIIWEDFEKRKEDGIIHCESIREIIDCVGKGKIASVFSDHSNKQILEMEKLVRSAEILGFQKSHEAGKDILSNYSTCSKAFISKRL